MSHKNLLLKKIHHLQSKKLNALEKFILVLLGIGVLFILAFLYNRANRAVTNNGIDEYVSAEHTVGYISVNDFSFPSQMQSTQELLQNQIKTDLETNLGIKYADAVNSWMGEQMGLIVSKDDTGKNSLILFLETTSKGKTLDFFKSQGLKGEELENANGVYDYPQSQAYKLTFAGAYVFISSDESALKDIVEVKEGKQIALASEPNYQKTFSNLPRNNWVSGYLNVQEFNLADNSALGNLHRSLKVVLNNAALTIVKEHNGFHFNTFFNLNKDLLTLNESTRDRTKFAYELTNDISSKDLAMYIGGANLSQEWINTLETITNLNPAYGLILEGILRSQVNQIFGTGVDLRNDIYPLLEGEYALAMGKNEDNALSLSVLLSHTNKEFVDVKLAKLMQGFKLLAARFSPRVHVVTLPDGTESRELVASKESVAESDETYQGYDLHCIAVNETHYGFCYATTDDLIIMTNNKDLAKETLDTTLSPKFVLAQYQPFRQTVGNLSQVSDEITFVDIQKTLPIFSKYPWITLATPVLSHLDAASWVKHYFDDGVSAEGFVLIK